MYLIPFLILLVPLALVFRNARKETRNPLYDAQGAEYRRMIGFTGYPHDGSVEYVLTNSQIQELVKPVLFDQDGYFPTNTESKED